MYTKLCPCPPSFNAFTNPDFFLSEQFVGALLLERFLMQALCLALLILRERAGIAAQMATIQFNNAGRKPIQKPPVMGNEQQRHITGQ